MQEENKKKIINNDLELLEGNHTMFPSLFNIGDSVFVEIQKQKIIGWIRTVTFTKGKVRYSVKCALSLPDPIDIVVKNPHLLEQIEDFVTLHNLDSFLIKKAPLHKLEWDFDNYS